jgi:hypothetical protein
MRLRSILFLLLLSSFVYGQNKLSGRVLIAGSSKPVPFANVYLSNTSVGTITDEKGNFVITDFPKGRFDLVVSSLSYEIYHQTIQSNKLPLLAEIFLVPKARELKEVILAPYDIDGWEKWGKLFMENFIGTSSFSQDCKLLNKEVVKLRLDKKTNTIKAFATDQLLIENHALGYILKYDLTAFEYNLDTKVFYYKGYPFFQKMNTRSKALERRWNSNRETVYYGSLMHFLRSVYQDKIAQQQFEVREWVEVSEQERKRVNIEYNEHSWKRVAKENGIIVGGIWLGATYYIYVNMKDTGRFIHADTMAYYKSVIKQEGEKNVLVDILLEKKNIAFVIDSLTMGLKFGSIEVVYVPKKNLQEYKNAIPKNLWYLPVASNLNRIADKPVSVFANGSFFDGLNLVTDNYWSWWEKMCNLLPYEYQPPLKLK